MGVNGTVYAIVTLMARSAAKANWSLYRDNKDGRRRYTTRDAGSDQRVEVLNHQAMNVWHFPNKWMSRHELVYMSQQWLELTGEAFWLVMKQGTIPTALWPINPSKMTPVPDPVTFLKGWVYEGPSGEKIPLMADEVIQIKYPNPLDIYRGLGPLQSVLVNVDAAKYSSEWNRNYFLNSAQPDAIITVPSTYSDEEFSELSNRWREAHQGVSRSHRVAFLEAGSAYVPLQSSIKEMDFANLTTVSRDLIMQAWGVHKVMIGVSDDVNRANAQTGEEVHSAWQTIPRLDLIKMTLNKKFLPLFGAQGKDVEFDYRGVDVENREEDRQELVAKAQATQFLVSSGYDPHDVLEVVGLPDMDTVPTPAPVKAPSSDVNANDNPDDSTDNVQARYVPALMAKKDAAAKVFEAVAKDYPPAAMAWVHDTDWSGPVDVPLNHLDMSDLGEYGNNQDSIDHFKKEIQDKGHTKPVILVKTPSASKLAIIDGHTRVTAYSQLDEPVRAYIGTVDSDEGPWDTMHDQQYSNMIPRLMKMLSNGHLPVQEVCG